MACLFFCLLFQGESAKISAVLLNTTGNQRDCERVIQMMKRKAIFLVCVLFVGALSGGCGQPASDKAGSPAAGETKNPLPAFLAGPILKGAEFTQAALEMAALRRKFSR